MLIALMLIVALKSVASFFTTGTNWKLTISFQPLTVTARKS